MPTSFYKEALCRQTNVRVDQMKGFFFRGRKFVIPNQCPPPFMLQNGYRFGDVTWCFQGITKQAQSQKGPFSSLCVCLSLPFSHINIFSAPVISITENLSILIRIPLHNRKWGRSQSESQTDGCLNIDHC